MYVPPDGTDADLTSAEGLDKAQKFKSAVGKRKAYQQVHDSPPLKTGYKWITNKPYGGAWSLGTMYVFLMLDNGGFPRSKKELGAWLTAAGQKDHSSIPKAGGMFKSAGPGVIALNLPVIRRKIFGNAKIMEYIREIVHTGDVTVNRADVKLLREWDLGKNLWHGSKSHAGFSARALQENPPNSGTFELTDEYEERMHQLFQ